MEPKQYSPLTLAFLGDAVFELFVRERLIASGSMPVGQLHKMAVDKVCATAQCHALDSIKDILTEEEEAIFKRGRNASGNSVPKSATPTEYRIATGIETLFGYLYLKKDYSRLLELFERMMEE